MKNLPFSRPTISKKDLISVLEHLIEEDLSTGETTHRFEKEIGKILGLSDRAVITNSGSTSLLALFEHLEIKSGDEIILSPLSEPWIWEVLNRFSAVPVWVDISVETLQMNPEQLLKKLTAKTRAVIISHHFGYPFFMNPALKQNQEFSFSSYLSDYSQVKVIEDLTSALFTKYREQYLGGFGDYAFACFESPRIITTGKGGVVFSKNKSEAKSIREKCSLQKRPVPDSGANSSPEQAKPSVMDLSRLDLALSDMQAALGLSELSLVEKMIARREQIKKFYQDALAKGRHSFIMEEEEVLSNHFTFPVILNGDINTAKQIFKKEKIEIRDLVQDTCYELMPYHEDLKNIHQLRHKVIKIPIYPTLKKEEIEKITLLLNSIR